jgi:hypothetical protein
MHFRPQTGGDEIHATRKRLIVPTALLATLASGSCAQEQLDYKRPGCNVVFISIDTLRADHLGCQGYPRSTSPEIDDFSRNAVLFRRAIA